MGVWVHNQSLLQVKKTLWTCLPSVHAGQTCRQRNGSSGRTRNCLQTLTKELSGHGWQS
jgi:hypothetical protein